MMRRFVVAAFAAFFLICGRGCYRPVVESTPLIQPAQPAPGETRPPRGAYIAYSRAQNVFTLGNGWAERQLWIHDEKKGVVTGSFRLKKGGYEAVASLSDEWLLDIGGAKRQGYGGDMMYVSHEKLAMGDGLQQLRLVFESVEPGMRVELHYNAHPDKPLFGKRMAVTNTGEAPFELRRAETERLNLRPVSSARRWVNGRSLVQTNLPIVGGEESGLIWLQAGEAWLGVMNAAPGPLKRLSAGRNGALSAGLNGSVWLHPGETVHLPPAYLWLSSETEPESANAEWTALFDAARRANHLASDAGNLVVLKTRHPSEQELLNLPAGSLVCVPYAWQQGRDEERGEWVQLTETAERTKAAGLRFGLWTPAAWLPDGGSLIEQNPEWSAGQPMEWRGQSGVLAQIDSEYGQYLEQTLLGLTQDLELDGLILDGQIAPNLDAENPPDIIDPRWGAWNRLLYLIVRLKSSRPQLTVGVARETYGMKEGFDASLYSWAFIWSQNGADDGVFWRSASSSEAGF